MSWGDDGVRVTPPRPGVWVAAEQLVRTRLEAFDSHRWMLFHLPGQQWICTACWRSIEAAGERPCPLEPHPT